MFHRLYFRLVAVLAIAVFAAFVSLDLMEPGGRRLAKIKGEDPVAYFGITHSILFDHDFNLNNEFERVPPSGRLWTLTRPATGLPGSPWGLGYSFLEIPLLAFGTGIDALTKHAADGYGPWAVYFYAIGSPLLAGLGLLALYSLLWEVAGYWKLASERTRAFLAFGITVVMFFGTSIGYYAFSEMSHSATFLFSSWFLLRWWRMRDSASPRDWLVLGLIGGFFSICRWQDVLELGAPILAALPFRGDAAKNPGIWWRTRLLYALGIAVCWIPQLAEFKAIYGSYLTIPHGGGIFSFPPPHMLQVLISTQSGWLTWTPIMILALAGLGYAAFRAPRLFVPWIVPMVLQVALVGSLPFWDGEGSFGSRYLLSQVPLAAMGLVTLFAFSREKVRVGLAFACIACVLFTGLFAIEYRLDVVPTATPLTFSELVTDRIRPLSVLHRRAALKQAQELMSRGDTESAIRILEAAQSMGEDRNIDFSLAEAYRAAGKSRQAEEADRKYRNFLRSELY